MSKTGRNDSCPCGSGKKYKHCCLAKSDAEQMLFREQHEALICAVEWLMTEYPDEVETAQLYDFFGDHEDMALQDAVEELPEESMLMVIICLHEWLIGDAVLQLDEEPVRAVDLVLGKGGPLLTANGRRHLESLAESRLSLFEVQAVTSGRGMLVQDLLQPESPPVFVYEQRGSEVLVQWDILGARILPHPEGHSLGGGVYPIPRGAGSELVQGIQKIIKTLFKHKRTVGTPQEIATRCIIRAWLELMTAPQEMPQFMDQQTGEEILFVTDTYAVSSWSDLTIILATQQDIVQETDDKWTRTEDIDEDRYRSLAHLERCESGELEVECRTRGRADTSRMWLESLANTVLTHTGRRTLNPRQAILSDSPSASRTPKKKKTESHDEIPLELQQQIIQQYKAEHYEKWISMPIPALNGKTPLQAVKLKTMRPKVIELLKQMERGEAKQAQQSGIPAFDIGFVRQLIGLD